MTCVHCESWNISKNWKLLSWGQRRKCGDCSKQFSVWWARDTYSTEFKKQVIDEYCHSPAKAKEVLNKHWISSRTLIKRKKEHRDGCSQCEQLTANRQQLTDNG
jgi:transposase-like protein